MASAAKVVNISLLLDRYEDIFSDFDPRPFSQRSLSDDFLRECKKVVQPRATNGDKLEVQLLVPHAIRHRNHEMVIAKRIAQYFSRQHQKLEHEVRKTRINGAIWFCLGVCLSLLASAFYDYSGFQFRILVTLLEPGSWFFMWSGFDLLYWEVKAKQADISFAHQMAGLRVYFADAEVPLSLAGQKISS